MKPLGLTGLIISASLAATAQAGISTGDNDAVLSSGERCANAINDYLTYRQVAMEIDAYTMEKLENHINDTCIGYQITLVENNGVMTGVVEVAD